MPRILLVEDNEANRDMMSRWLIRQGYKVTMAVDGEEAISKSHSDHPDLILMDLSLPKIDGWETTKVPTISLLEYPRTCSAASLRYTTSPNSSVATTISGTWPRC